MRYDAQSGKLHICADELVRTAYRGISGILPRDEDMPPMARAAAEGTPIPFTSGGYDFLLFPTADANDGETTVQTFIRGRRPSRDEKAVAEAEGFINAYIHFSIHGGEGEEGAGYSIKTVYRSLRTGECIENQREVTPDKLGKFFEKCTSVIFSAAKDRKSVV